MIGGGSACLDCDCVPVAVFELVPDFEPDPSLLFDAVPVFEPPFALFEPVPVFDPLWFLLCEPVPLLDPPFLLCEPVPLFVFEPVPLRLRLAGHHCEVSCGPFGVGMLDVTWLPPGELTVVCSEAAVGWS